VRLDVGLDVIIVEQRIVNIDQEDDPVHRTPPYANPAARGAKPRGHVSRASYSNWYFSQLFAGPWRKKNHDFVLFGHSARYVPPREIPITVATLLMLLAHFHSTFGRGGSYQCMSGQPGILRLCGTQSR
jgi:hypothetical protein